MEFILYFLLDKLGLLFVFFGLFCIWGAIWNLELMIKGKPWTPDSNFFITKNTVRIIVGISGLLVAIFGILMFLSMNYWD